MNAGSNKCVLYCCPSNKAVDVVHSKYAFYEINFNFKHRSIKCIKEKKKASYYTTLWSCS